MVPLAAAAWAAAWVGTWGTAAVIAAAAAAVAVALAVAALRRSLLVVSVAMVATVIMGAGVVDVYRLHHGPVAVLAEHHAVVSVDLEIRGDPHRVATSGTRPAAAVTKAVTVRVAGRGSTWLVRAPVLVVVTGQQLGKWFDTPVGRTQPQRDELAIKLAVAVAVPSVDVGKVVQQQRNATMQALQGYRRQSRSGAGDDLAGGLVLDRLIFAAEAEIRWLDHCESRLRRAASTSTAPEPAESTEGGAR